jgi:peptidyl-tRNA hydrolase
VAAAPRRLYVLCRRDLPAAQQTVQACHAIAHFVLGHAGDEDVREWADAHRTIVVLGVDGERDLRAWRAELSARGVPCESFAEPDLGGETTSLAVHPRADRRLFRGLRLL